MFAQEHIRNGRVYICGFLEGERALAVTVF